MKSFALPHSGASDPEFMEIPAPRVTEGDGLILVEVRAVGVGIHDSVFLPPDPQYPYAIGIEGAGTIVAGTSSRGLGPGSRVAFVSSLSPRGGTWAEFAAVAADALIIPMPESMDFPTAAAIPVAGNTVLRALSALDDLPSGASLFIAGGSGAIGTLAIQLARQRGWRVAASASPQNHDYLSSLGVDLAVDYQEPQWPQTVLEWMPQGVDAAIAVQPNTSTSALSVVATGGRLISVSGDSVVAERDIEFETVPYAVDVREQLEQLLVEVADGRVHVELARVHPFSEALEALRMVQSRHARGKRVLSLD